MTGGGSGIGEAICRRFDEEGARVVGARHPRGRGGAHRRAARARVAAAAGGRHRLGAGEPRLRGSASSGSARIDVLVNNAGIAGGEESVRNAERFVQRLREAEAGEVTTPLEATVHITDEQFRVMMETHVFGAFYCIRAALPYMVAQGVREHRQRRLALRSGGVRRHAALLGGEGRAARAHAGRRPGRRGAGRARQRHRSRLRRDADQRLPPAGGDRRGDRRHARASASASRRRSPTRRSSSRATNRASSWAS